MTDRVIVETLQHCSNVGGCNGCPQDGGKLTLCYKAMKEAAELILRQKDLIEELQQRLAK